MRRLLLLLAIGLSAIVCAATDIACAGECKVADYGTLPVEMMGDRATTTVKINGEDTRFILDTGAFFGNISRANADAMKLKLEPAPRGFFGQGIGGTFTVQLTRVRDFGILGGTIRGVQFTVGGTDFGEGLIGANLLDMNDLDIDLAHGKLRLLNPSGCGSKPMAYWAQNGDYHVVDLLRPVIEHDERSFITVEINGTPVRALLDTGAPTTLLSRHAAEHAGIDLRSPEAKPSFAVTGLGRNRSQSWIVRVDAISVGDETIKHSQIQVMDGDIIDSYGSPDMLLGVDFFLANHLFVANSQKKIYFTYNGGRVFSLDKAPVGREQPTTESSDDAAALKTADDYALRGQAHLSRGELAAAVADLDVAIHLDPDKAPYYVARARAQLTRHQPDAAVPDLDQALALDSRSLEALLLRAAVRVRRNDKAGAEADIASARQLAPSGSEASRAIARFYVDVDQPAAA